MDDEIPPAILRTRPELVAVGEALAQHRRGEAITAQCTTCGRVLVLTDVQATGALVVRCPDGHVSFRARRKLT